MASRTRGSSSSAPGGRLVTPHAGPARGPDPAGKVHSLTGQLHPLICLDRQGLVAHLTRCVRTASCCQNGSEGTAGS